MNDPRTLEFCQVHDSNNEVDESLFQKKHEPPPRNMLFWSITVISRIVLVVFTLCMICMVIIGRILLVQEAIATYNDQLYHANNFKMEVCDNPSAKERFGLYATSCEQIGEFLHQSEHTTSFTIGITALYVIFFYIFFKKSINQQPHIDILRRISVYQNHVAV